MGVLGTDWVLGLSQYARSHQFVMVISGQKIFIENLRLTDE